MNCELSLYGNKYNLNLKFSLVIEAYTKRMSNVTPKNIADILKLFRRCIQLLYFLAPLFHFVWSWFNFSQWNCL